ncbi:5-(carboxyamino)imidazole ribonucleotide synthase, partial [Pseudomonas sp. FW305-20]|uniref:hypothetical protein n=1 Tax=Pseudomonas sp. FW305-20 TaxID=2070560 RepID=UPI000CC7BFC8
FEQEHIDEALLEKLTELGIPCFPTMASFQMLRNKLQQKDLLTKLKIPTSPYVAWVKDDVRIPEFIRVNQGAILKAGQGGYDGKGVWKV